MKKKNFIQIEYKSIVWQIIYERFKLYPTSKTRTKRIHITRIERRSYRRTFAIYSYHYWTRRLMYSVWWTFKQTILTFGGVLNQTIVHNSVWSVDFEVKFKLYRRIQNNGPNLTFSVPLWKTAPSHPHLVFFMKTISWF